MIGTLLVNSAYAFLFVGWGLLLFRLMGLGPTIKSKASSVPEGLHYWFASLMAGIALLQFLLLGFAFFLPMGPAMYWGFVGAGLLGLALHRQQLGRILADTGRELGAIPWAWQAHLVAAFGAGLGKNHRTIGDL